MKKIIHVDADCFFAAVEILKNPTLNGKPVAVGGSPNGRGVISTCNYEARKYGVRSAMASAHALRLCPFLNILKPRIELYREYSVAMREIFDEFSDKIEPLSLDEAFLDVSDTKNCGGSATLVAEEIRRRIRTELGITVSAGVASCKYLAKIASDWNKPDGIFVIPPKRQAGFIQKLEVKHLPGVGKVTQNRLARCGLYNCTQIQMFGKENMAMRFGRQGLRLFEMANGRDERPVSPRENRKTVSVERTFVSDIRDPVAVRENLSALFELLEARLKKVPSSQSLKKIFVKLKFNDFSQTTKETSLSNTMRQKYPLSGDTSVDVFRADYERLLYSAWQRGERPLRLIGIGIGLSTPLNESEQLSFCF